MKKEFKIKIAENEYALRYTIESWKRLKEFHEITPTNFDKKINEDMAECMSSLIFYGLSIEDRKKVTQEQVDIACDFSNLDLISEAIMEGMPKASKKKFEEEKENPSEKK